MYTCVQCPVCKKENTTTYVHTGRVLNAYSRICTWLGRNGETESSTCSWGGNGMRRVHGEATKCGVFMGRQQNASCSSGGLGRNRRWKRGLAYRRTEETALCSTAHVRNGILFIGGVWCTAKRRKRTSYGQNGGPVDREGCGVPQNR